MIMIMMVILFRSEPSTTISPNPATTAVDSVDDDPLA